MAGAPAAAPAEAVLGRGRGRSRASFGAIAQGVSGSPSVGMAIPVIGSIVSRFPQRSLVAIDLLVVTWTIVWIVLGVTVGAFLGRLSALGDGLQDAGRAVGRAGDAVGELSEMPLVGEGFAAIASEIREIGGETQADGRAVEEDIDRLAWLIGGSLALAPTLPILAVWVPPRLSRARERHTLRRSLRDGDRRAALGYLANRAVATRGFRELLEVSDDPVRDLADGRYEALASLELDHLSLRADGVRPAMALLRDVRSRSARTP